MGPKPPDPAKTAAAQQQINQQTAQQQFQFGATDQVTPGGSLTYTQTGTYPDGSPKYTATQSLSPENQGLYNSLIGAAGNAAGNISNPIATPQLQTNIDTSGLSALPTQGDYSVDRGRVEDAISARLNPQLEAGRTSRETDLFNRGVRPGTAAYDRAMGLVGQQENDARLQTILAGGQEQSRMFGDALAGRQQGYSEAANNANFGNNARTGMFGMNMAARSQPINEISSLMSGSQVNQPNYIPTPQPGVGGVDYAGLVQNQYQQQMDRRQNLLSGLFGLGSSIVGAIPWSDRRLKSNIERVGTHPLGIGIYTYDIFGARATGVMADELIQVMPGAVVLDTSGYYRVRYDMIDGAS
jgi:hypothetical protein